MARTEARSRSGQPGEGLRVLVLCGLVLAVLGLVAVIFAAFGGAAPLWLLAGFCVLSGGLTGWAARRQWETVRQTAPDQLMSGRDLVRYTLLATGAVLLTLVVHGVAALLG